MAEWFTSDLHFGHANIIRYCDRPFADVAEMNTALITRWNDSVSPDDTVWVLGDVAMGPIEHSLGLVTQLNGRKVLVTGNHDRCWPGNGKRAGEWESRYTDAGFADVIHGTTTLATDRHEVLAGHFPYVGDSHDEDRFGGERPPDNGHVLLHGHVHERWRTSGRMINVGVDAWDYRPVASTVIDQWIDARAADRPTSTVTIDGECVTSLDDVYAAFQSQALPNIEWGRNLDALNDVLNGGFGLPETGITLEWADVDVSRSRLGAVVDTVLDIARSHEPGLDRHGQPTPGRVWLELTTRVDTCRV